MAIIFALGLISLSVFILDQGIKRFVEKNLEVNGIIGSRLLNVSHFKNKGIAFSIPFQVEILYLLIFVLLVVLFWYYRKNLRQTFVLVCLGLILGGALSNVFDRIIRGGVLDYIGVLIWPTFNLADVAITLGVGLLFIKEITSSQKKKKSGKM